MTVPRELKITYGTIAAGGTTSGGTLTLLDVHRLQKTSEAFDLEYSFLLTSPIVTTYATAVGVFGTAAAAVEAVLNQDRLAVKVDALKPSDGSVRKNLITLQHSDNSGLNIRCEYEKQGSPHDTNLSRIYRVRVTGGLPPPGLAGRREFEWELDLQPATVGTLTATGVYTAVSGTLSKAQFDASIAARVATITTALGGTWELLTTTTKTGDTDQVTEFETVYKELIHDQSSGTRNDTTLRDVKLTIERETVGGEGSSSDRPLIRVRVVYSAFVVKTTTDLNGVWKGTVKPWIVTNVKDYLDDDRLAIIASAPKFDPFENQLTATMEILAPGGSSAIRRIVTTTDDLEFGHIFREVWPAVIPDDENEPTPVYDFGGPKRIFRTIETVTTTLGRSNPAPISRGGRGGGQIPVGIGGPRWNLGLGDPFENAFGIGVISKPGETFVVFDGAAGASGGAPAHKPGGAGAAGGMVLGKLVRKTTRTTPRVEGAYPDQFDVTDITVIEVMRVIKTIGGGGANTGGGPAKNVPASMRGRRK